MPQINTRSSQACYYWSWRCLPMYVWLCDRWASRKQ